MTWYNDLSRKKQQLARQAISKNCEMGRSTFYKIVKGEFNPNEANRQILANIAGVSLKFGTQIVKPAAIDTIGAHITEPNEAT